MEDEKKSGLAFEKNGDGSQNGDVSKAESGLDNPAFEKDGDGLQNGDASKMVRGGRKERAEWDNGVEFLMSCIAMSVGLGNIWRFPFATYENGGGAFLVPYVIVLVVIGTPIYYLEMALGQFSSRGNIRFYRALSPYLKGVGYGQVIGSLCVGTYYCCLIAIILFYLAQSFTVNLPWASCLDEWTHYLQETGITCVSASAVRDNVTDTNNTVSSAELYFRLEVLKEKTDISDGIGNPDWRLTLCLLAVWIVTYLISVKGVKSSGKAAYFLALFPYVLMVTLLVRAATLEGAAEGMYYLVKTDWSKLAEPTVWYSAVTQCFFSLSVGSGGLITYASYNNFEYNLKRDALIVPILDTLTSLLCGITIFGILGNLAYNLGVAPDEVINSGGSGLAFISYPDAIAKFEAVPWLFSILFFFMLLVLGIGSLVAIQNNQNAVIHHLFPDLATWKVSLVTAVVLFLIGLMYLTPGGQFMLNLVDYFGGTFLKYVFVIFEVTGVAWVYGIENFCLDMEFMLKTKVGIYWRITWAVIIPVLLVAILIYFLVRLERLMYGPYDYPDGILAFGWCILGVAVLQCVLWTVYYIYANRQYGFPQMVTRTFGHDEWGPLDPARYEEWKKFKEDAWSQINARPGGRWGKRFKVLIAR